MTELAGRTAIVTGGARGIGLAITRALARQGCSLVVNYRSSRGPAEAIARELAETGTEVELVGCGIEEPGAARQIVEAAIARFGRIDLLVNNAGINRDATLGKLDRRAYEEVLDVNVIGTALLSTAAAARMIEAGFGRIVTISSFVGQKGNFGQANYAAAKAGLIAWTKTAAIELARYGITANVVCPGFVSTDMLAAVPEKVRERILATIPLGRFADPAEIAEAVVFALGAGYMTGAQVDVNGGVYM